MSRQLSHWQALVLGTVVLAGLALGAWALSTIGNRHGLGGDVFRVHACFADIGGVEVGAPVHIQGMPVGEVEAIVPPQLPGESVKLRLRVAGKVRHLVTQDARVQIANENLLAGRLVRIVPGNAQSGPVDDGAELAALPITDLTDNIAQASAQLHTLLAKANTLVDEIGKGEGPLGAVSKDLAQATTRLNKVLARADATLDGLHRGEGTLGKLLTDESLYTELTTALSQLNGAMKDIRGGEGTLGKLVKSNEVYAEALMSLQDVRRMVASVKQNSDAIKALPVVRSYIVDPHKELVRPDCIRHRQWFPEDALFEPGRAVLTAKGRRALDQAAVWLKEHKEEGAEVVVAAFADPKDKADFAQTLTQKQSEAVCDYLKGVHNIHKTGWWLWSRRTVRPIGCGASPSPVPETESLAPARVELLVFVPEK